MSKVPIAPYIRQIPNNIIPEAKEFSLKYIEDLSDEEWAYEFQLLKWLRKEMAKIGNLEQ